MAKPHWQTIQERNRANLAKAMASTEPDEAKRREAEERYIRTHPPDVPRISGCCDPADQD